MSEKQAKALLIGKFEARHVDASLKHIVAATEKFIAEDWDGVALKAGKFVEAVTKALMVHCGKTVPTNARHFKAGVELKQLEQTNSTAFSDVVRILIPKACIFIYEIVNNRGGRHDAGEIDANEMDAKIVLPVLQWILAEMVRFASVGGDTTAAAALIDEITNKVYPYFEKIDGRTYVSVNGLGAPDVALLLLYEAYPKRITRKTLVDAVVRHGHKDGAASMAVSRLNTFVDEDNGNFKLRAPGRDKAAVLLKKLHDQRAA